LTGWRIDENIKSLAGWGPPLKSKVWGNIAMAGMFEIFVDQDQLYRFRLLDGNKEVLSVSVGYRRKLDAVAAIAAVRESAATGHITDCSPRSHEAHGKDAQHKGPRRDGQHKEVEQAQVRRLPAGPRRLVAVR
jgi:uncharacterized protein